MLFVLLSGNREDISSGAILRGQHLLLDKLIVLQHEDLGLVPHEFVAAILEGDQATNIGLKRGYLRVQVQRVVFQFDIEHHHDLDGCLEGLLLMLSEQLSVDVSDVWMNYDVDEG